MCRSCFEDYQKNNSNHCPMCRTYYRVRNQNLQPSMEIITKIIVQAEKFAGGKTLETTIDTMRLEKERAINSSKPGMLLEELAEMEALENEKRKKKEEENERLTHRLLEEERMRENAERAVKEKEDFEMALKLQKVEEEENKKNKKTADLEKNDFEVALKLQKMEEEEENKMKKNKQRLQELPNDKKEQQLLEKKKKKNIIGEKTEEIVKNIIEIDG